MQLIRNKPLLATRLPAVSGRESKIGDKPMETRMLCQINFSSASMIEQNPYFYTNNFDGVYSSPKDAKIDAELAHQRLTALNKRPGPRVGDFVQFPGECAPRRFTYDWSDGTMQTTVPPKGHPCSGDVSFHMYRNGHCDFSGSLDPSIPLERCADSGETRLGRVWFFSRDWSGAHRGVSVMMPFRVYNYQPA
jgi:hypothetical protein